MWGTAMISQDNAAQELAPPSVVIAFPERRLRASASVARRLTLRDRVEAIRWAETARARGVSRAAIHTGGDAQIGDFILVYLTGALWASWVIGCKPCGYCVWRAGSGADIGCYPTLGMAFAAVEAML
jgi:hypothetical protein